MRNLVAVCATIPMFTACRAHLPPTVDFIQGTHDRTGEKEPLCGLFDYGLEDTEVPRVELSCRWRVVFAINPRGKEPFVLDGTVVPPPPWTPSEWTGTSTQARWVTLIDPVRDASYNALGSWSVPVDNAERGVYDGDDRRVRDFSFGNPWHLVFEIVVRTNSEIRPPRIPGLTARPTVALDDSGDLAVDSASACGRDINILLFVPLSDTFDVNRDWTSNPIANVPVFCSSNQVGVLALALSQRVREPLDVAIQIRGRPWRHLRVVPGEEDNFTVVKVALPDGVGL